MADTPKTRQQCIDQINAVAESWGLQRPTITNKTSDEQLRRLCNNLDRQGKKLGSNQ